MASNKQHMPFPNDGWSTDDRATATCFCGAVQLSFVRATIGETHAKEARMNRSD